MSKEFFDRLRTTYDISVPDINLVLGRNDKGQDRMLMVVDKIEGQSIEESRLLPAEAKEKFDSFYASLFSSILDDYRANRFFFSDVDNSQFVYGRKQGDSEDSVYLVDVEPKSIASIDLLVSMKGGGPGHIFHDLIGLCGKTLSDVEKKFSPPQKPWKARSKFEEMRSYAEELLDAEG